MCHADADAGASLPLEAPSPTRIECEWLRRALLPLGMGQLLSVHTVDHQLPRRLVYYRGMQQCLSAARVGDKS